MEEIVSAGVAVEASHVALAVGHVPGGAKFLPDDERRSPRDAVGQGAHAQIFRFSSTEEAVSRSLAASQESEEADPLGAP